MQWEGRSRWALRIAVALSTALALGCDAKTAAPKRSATPMASTQGGLFDSVADNLNRVEEFDTSQVLRQICDRLNQWYLQDKPKIDWQPDPLVAQLPEEYRGLLGVKLLDSAEYRLPEDAWFLLEAVWLRNISSQARGDQFEDLAVAQKLFDWTIRNVQLDADPANDENLIRHRPFEALLYGRATAEERAWVFTLLARQQGLDIVQLALADPQGKPPRWWLSALVAGNELHLFDCRLGLPIPGPAGKGVATLAQVVTDPQLLRRLDLDAERPYPVTADDLQGIAAFVEGSPLDMSRRMALVESRLTGKQKMILTSPGHRLAERVKQLPHVSQVRLWPLPFEVALWQAKLSDAGIRLANRDMYLFQTLPTVVTGHNRQPLRDQRGRVAFEPQPILLTGRALHFKGQYDGLKGAKAYYLSARPTDEIINDFKLPAHVEREMRPEDLPRLEAAQIVAMRRAKQNATYWLGLIHFEQHHHDEAIDFLGKRTLEATPNGPWAAGARFNLARLYEESGQPEKAAELYGADTSSPQSHGNQLRGRWLQEAIATVPSTGQVPATDAEKAGASPAASGATANDATATP
jgi:tetratricopeptide (TPR) repeat protein